MPKKEEPKKDAKKSTAKPAEKPATKGGCGCKGSKKG